jgi:hypothetical protein
MYNPKARLTVAEALQLSWFVHAFDDAPAAAVSPVGGMVI